jgi:hypothetical protein
MEVDPVWQGQTDTYLRSLNEKVCGNDYMVTATATNSKSIRNLFVPPNSTPGGDPRPVFLAINCVSNSPSHKQWQLMLKEFYDGGGALDFTARIAAWRALIDSVQAPPPRLTNAPLAGGSFEFTFPGQRGRTNRVECSTNLLNWVAITNYFGTNAPIRFRDTNLPANEERFYRVVRP